MEQQMYGSTHTHFEDLFDTGNDKKKMVCEFARLGAKRVALTGHGSMFAYEDLKEIVASLKDTKEIPEDFEIVPGCEVYFEEDAKHMVLVAKDYEGYKQLCRIVTASAKNSKTSKNTSEDIEYLTPIVTFEHLENAIKEDKGHLYMTSACEGGVFGKDLGLEEIETYQKDFKKKQANFNKILTEVKVAREIIQQWEDVTKNPENKKLTKKENEKLEEALANGDEETAKALQQRQSNYDAMVVYKEENKKSVDAAKRKLKSMDDALEKMTEAEQKLEEYKENYPARLEMVADRYKKLESIFGKENIYFELQNHGLEAEALVFNNVIELAYKVGNPNFITSNDVHIGDRKGSDTWEQSVLKREVERFNRYKSISKRGDEEEYGIKTDSELKEELLKIIKPFVDKDGVEHSAEEIVDNAIANIQVAMEPCHIEFPTISIDGTNFYPKFCEDEASMFRAEVEKGMAEKFPNGLPEGYRERLDYEMNIIESMGFSGYLLIVQDYIKYGKLLGYLRTEEEIANAPLSIEGLNKYIDDNNIPRVGMGVGPGRGSAAGCLAAYAMDIVDVDPMKYGLMFERFLNPSRRSMPDIDTDFKDDIRERLYEYICAKWGYECVSKVCTKAEAHGKKAADIASQYLAAKECVGREKAEEVDIKKDYLEAKKRVSSLISKYMKEHDLAETKVENGTKAAVALYEERKNDPDQSKEFKMEQDILKMTGEIAGIPSNISMHACACLISGTPLSEVIPLAWNDAKQKMTTQCLYPQAEELGLLKMDLLNIKNLTVITKVMQDCEVMGFDSLLNSSEGIETLLNDSRIYDEIFCKGRTNGVFQFESDGMTNMVKEFQPRCFDDIIILVAAYRPGPIDFIPEVIAEKWWREKGEASPYGVPKHKININNDKLKAILAPTYGVPIYQEQIMKIVQELAGYNMADADNVRKYMSKKKTALLEKERGFFVYGSEHVICESQKKLDELRALPIPTEEQIKEANALEAEIKKMPTYIQGCVPNGVCTAEEANKLFDAMMEFGKYAFNKSHALCYAQVAMYTAYQKLYFPKLFYKYTLSNETKDGPSQKDKRMATEKYIDEMKSFGINLLPPSPSMSEDDYTIEDGDIRMGFGCIKGCSYEKYNPADNVMMFMASNPDVTVKTAIGFAKLGLFDKIYPTGNTASRIAEVERVAGNRKCIVDWINEHGEEARAYGNINKELKEISSEKDALDAKLKDLEAQKNASMEEQTTRELSKQINEVKSELSSLVEQYQSKYNEYLEYKQLFITMRRNDGAYPKRTGKDCVNDRAFEYEKMGIVFSAKEDFEVLKTCGEHRTIRAFNAKRNAMSKNQEALVAATVVGKQENKSGKGPKFRITLMDKNGETLQVSSWDKVDPVSEITCGLFSITGGDYANLRRVNVLNAELDNPETDKSKFNPGKEVSHRINPFNGEKIEFQNKDVDGDERE